MAHKKTPVNYKKHLKPGERPTLKTIASITNLGVTTVSRALKDAPEIGEKTKQRVRSVADEVGYIPNRAGVGLRTGKTHIISLVLSLNEEIMGLSSHLVRGLSETLSDTPYHLTITPYTKNNNALDAIRHIVETRSADGIILSRTEPKDERVAYLHKQRVPFVTHGRTRMGIEHPYHDFDNEQFTFDAVNRLIAKKRTRIALFGPPDNLMFYKHSMAGYRKALNLHGLKTYPALGFTIDDSLDSVEILAAKLFSRSSRPDGIISMSGGTTIPLCCGIEQAGLQLGKDLDIVSKQSVNILPRFRPQIETVHEDIQMAGRELARLIIASIHETPATQLQTIAPPLNSLV